VSSRVRRRLVAVQSMTCPRRGEVADMIAVRIRQRQRPASTLPASTLPDGSQASADTPSDAIAPVEPT